MTEPSPRQQLVDLFADKLDPDVWDVLTYETKLGNIRKMTVMCGVSRVEPGPSGVVWACTVRIIAAAPYESFDRAEDELEAAVVTILSALAGLSYIAVAADRVTYGEDPQQSRQAWRIDVTLPLQTHTTTEP